VAETLTTKPIAGLKYPGGNLGVQREPSLPFATLCILVFLAKRTVG
jgi:hypothetical protein